MSAKTFVLLSEEFSKLGIKYSLDSIFQGTGEGLPHKTVTDKGILLGFNSMQLEIQTDIRKRLVRDRKFINKFANILKNIHMHMRNFYEHVQRYCSVLVSETVCCWPFAAARTGTPGASRAVKGLPTSGRAPVHPRPKLAAGRGGVVGREEPASLC